MFPLRAAELHRIFLFHQVLDEQELDRLRMLSRLQGRVYAEWVMRQAGLRTGELLQWVAEWVGLPLVSEGQPSRFGVSTRVLQLASELGIWVFGQEADCLQVAAIDPFAQDWQDSLRLESGMRLQVFVADPDRVREGIKEQGDGSNRNVSALGCSEGSAIFSGTDVVARLDALIAEALQRGASDVHFEPGERHFRIRIRVDGSMVELPLRDAAIGFSMISRIKVLARLDIAECRLPQDGKWVFEWMGRRVDVRVSTLPTVCGESTVLRLLDRARVPLSLDFLGMPLWLVQALRRAAFRPHGLLLATGPTGSGKTTTLYSLLDELRCPERKCMSVEDPVEYELDGMVQVQVQSAIGLGFERLLRAFLRQDPDVILIGEIRDPASAMAAVQASLTGHLVMSSLHSNDALGAVSRLMDLGVASSLLAACLNGVLAQRLLGRLDPENCEWYAPDRDLLREQFPDWDGGMQRFRRARPNLPQNQAPVKGRTGIFEWLELNAVLRAAVQSGQPAHELRKLALFSGMRCLRTDALRALGEGLVQLEEVLACTRL
jgi:type IV pilus assembly protein PilB